MEDKKELKEIVQESKRLYDEQCKKILSYKQILSYLFQSCLEEYKDLSLEEIQELLEKETESEMRKMCTFSDAIWEKGKDEGIRRSVINLMKNHVTSNIEEAMDLLGVEASLRPAILKSIQMHQKQTGTYKENEMKDVYIQRWICEKRISIGRVEGK